MHPWAGGQAPAQALQGIVFLALAGAVPQARHVHGVGMEPLAGDAAIGHHMAVEAVVVPHLLDRRAEEWPEGLLDRFLLSLGKATAPLQQIRAHVHACAHAHT